MYVSDHRITGWDLPGGIHVHPPEAYTSWEPWFSHFCATFPDKAQKMRDYSASHGWPESLHTHRWIPVCVKWLNEQEQKTSP
jgi:hypothetical protein